TTDVSNETGFLVIDQTLKVISINTAAIRILIYPDSPTEVDMDRISEKIHCLLPETHVRQDALFMAGRREYLSRVLPITLHSGESVEVTAILLERRINRFADLVRMLVELELDERKLGHD
ncbi:MAG: hypothetical protein ABGY96_09155, partial [bacterium]